MNFVIFIDLMILIFLLQLVKSEAKSILKIGYNDKILRYSASGSSKQRINGSRQMTKPEYAFDQVDKRYDWCSNCGVTDTDFPWITFSLENRRIRLSSYFIKAGCCYDGCCCAEAGYCVHCCLYSWSLQVSNDNKTWTEAHKVEKDRTLEYCAEKTFTLDKAYDAKYVRLIQTEACPGDPPCIALNKIELYGDILGDSPDDDFVSYHDDDDDISIIGHISHQGNVHLPQ